MHLVSRVWMNLGPRLAVALSVAEATASLVEVEPRSVTVDVVAHRSTDEDGRIPTVTNSECRNRSTTLTDIALPINLPISAGEQVDSMEFGWIP